MTSSVMCIGRSPQSEGPLENQLPRLPIPPAWRSQNGRYALAYRRKTPTQSGWFTYHGCQKKRRSSNSASGSPQQMHSAEDRCPRPRRGTETRSPRVVPSVSPCCPRVAASVPDRRRLLLRRPHRNTPCVFFFHAVTSCCNT
jgi:hypothetical protein